MALLKMQPQRIRRPNIREQQLNEGACLSGVVETILLMLSFSMEIRTIFDMGNCTSDFGQRKTARKSFDFTTTKSSKSPLVFKIKTWPQLLTFDLKDTQNCLQRSIDASLYEGETIQINLRSSLQVNASCQSLSNSMNFTLKCEISKNNKCYTVKFPEEEEKKYLWKFVGSWTELQEGDIIRMGKTKYRLSKLVHSQQSNSYKSLKNIDESQAASNRDLDDHRCRICLSSSETPDNPLVSPCKCTGSVKFTHFKCLSNWLFDLNMEENCFIKIRVNKSICELCKTDITGTPEYKQMTDMLLGNAANIPTPYSIFEVYQREEQKQKDYFILSFNNKSTYTFGRSSKADVCDINDRCISKFNSEIVYKNERLMIKDCESMHGTYMKVKNDLKLFGSNLTEDISYRNMIIKAQYMPMFDRQ